MPREKRVTVKLLLRLPPELHAELVRLAALADRSLNGEIVARLRESTDTPKRRAK